MASMEQSQCATSQSRRRRQRTHWHTGNGAQSPALATASFSKAPTVQQSESLGLEADCTCMDAVAEGQVLAPQSSLKLPQHGFSRGCDQKKENPDQGCPHLSFL